MRDRALNAADEGATSLSFPQWDRVQSILLLYESDYIEKNADIKSIIARLQAEGKRVVAWGYVNKKDVSSAVLPGGRIIGKRELTFFNKPKKEVIADLRKQHFDLVLNLSLSFALPLRYLDLLADAAFRVGAQSASDIQSINDIQIMINQEDNAIFLFEQAMFYLSHIKSKI